MFGKSAMVTDVGMRTSGSGTVTLDTWLHWTWMPGSGTSWYCKNGNVVEILILELQFHLQSITQGYYVCCNSLLYYTLPSSTPIPQSPTSPIHFESPQTLFQKRTSPQKPWPMLFSPLNAGNNNEMPYVVHAFKKLAARSHSLVSYIYMSAVEFQYLFHIRPSPEM